jgi:hypothetical protein
MRRSGQPSRPNARTCCCVSSPKMLVMSAGRPQPPRRRQRLGARLPHWPVFSCPRLAGFGCPPRPRPPPPPTRRFRCLRLGLLPACFHEIEAHGPLLPPEGKADPPVQRPCRSLERLPRRVFSSTSATTSNLAIRVLHSQVSCQTQRLPRGEPFSSYRANRSYRGQPLFSSSSHSLGLSLEL